MPTPPRRSPRTLHQRLQAARDRSAASAKPSSAPAAKSSTQSGAEPVARALEWPGSDQAVPPGRRSQTPDGLSLLGWPDDSRRRRRRRHDAVGPGRPVHLSRARKIFLPRINSDYPGLRVHGGMASGMARAGRDATDPRAGGPRRSAPSASCSAGRSACAASCRKAAGRSATARRHQGAGQRHLSSSAASRRWTSCGRCIERIAARRPGRCSSAGRTSGSS